MPTTGRLPDERERLQTEMRDKNIQDRVVTARTAARHVSLKWQPEIIISLYYGGGQRYHEIRDRRGVVHNKVLDDALSGLVDTGLVHREETTRGWVYYSLSPAGRDMAVVLAAIGRLQS